MFLLLSKYGYSQKSLPDSLHAYYTTEEIKLDGKLSEQAWKNAITINNFTQRELHQGKPATEKTEIGVLYNANTLYIGIWCYDSDFKKIKAKYLGRDFVYDNDDNILLNANFILNLN